MGRPGGRGPSDPGQYGLSTGSPSAALSLRAGVLYDVLGLEQARLAIALAAFAAGRLFVGRSVPAWHQLLAYARDGERGAK